MKTLLQPANNLVFTAFLAIFFSGCVSTPHLTDTNPTQEERVQQYITAHPDLNDQEINALRSGAVTPREIEDNRESAARNAPANREQHSQALADQQAILDAVASHQIALDMTAAQLLASWGEPASRTHTVSHEDVYDAWFYPDRSTTVSLYNGIVTHWTTTEHTPDRSAKLPPTHRGLKRTDL